MKKQKTTDKVTDIPYTGALKKLFDPVRDVNIRGECNVGKKYLLKQALATPRQWSLEVQKLPKDSGYCLRVVVNSMLPPCTEVAYTTIASVTVTDVKKLDDKLILWVVNASGSVANLYFFDDEDKFEPRPLLDSFAVHGGAIAEFRSGPILHKHQIANLTRSAVLKMRAIAALLSKLTEINKVVIARATADATPRGRKRPSAPTIACPPAGSREKKGKRKRTDDAEEVAEPSTAVVTRVQREDSEEEVASDDYEVQAGADTTEALIDEGDVALGGQLPTDRSEKDEVVPAKPSKCKKKETPKNKRKSTCENMDIGPRVMKKKEKQFREECGTSAEEQEESQPKKPRKKKHPKKHPKKVPEGKEIDVKTFQEELIEFRDRVKPMYIWGQAFTAEVDVKYMELAPKEMKYRPFHSSLEDSLFQVFLTSLHPVKQTLTLMPICDEKPATYEDAKNMKFYIINGQHSWAAACRLLVSKDVDSTVKNMYRTWTCDFVWTDDNLLLSELSRRVNNTNQFHWDSPEYLLHIQYARDLWVHYGRPTSDGKSKSKWKVGHLCHTLGRCVRPVGNCPLGSNCRELEVIQ